jgi:5-methylcytosine-specific restriction endonuclease McrA
MKTYSEKLKDPRWQKKRLDIMQRDGFKCRDCGDGEKTLNVHHCHYAPGGPWETPDHLLLTLCADCHEERGSLEVEIKRYIASSFAGTPPAQLAKVASKLRSVAGKGYSINLRPVKPKGSA